MTAALGLLAVAVLTAATGLFVAAEFAFVTLDPAQIEAQADPADRRTRSVLAGLRQLSFELSGAQLGITVTTLALGFVAEPTIARLLTPPLHATGLPGSHGVAVGLALVLATVISMVLGELVPKNWALSRPLPVARAVAGPHRMFSRACRPVIAGLNGAANALVRRLGIEPQEELRSARSPAELGSLVRASGEQGTLPPRTAALLDRALRFRDRDAAAVMTPRVRVVALAEADSVADLLARAAATGHSRFPVYGTDLDDVTGVVHVKAAFAIPAAARATWPVAGIAAPVRRVPASLSCEALLALLRRHGLQLAVVADEYGGTAGVVTLEDLVEELVGEVDDEHDPPDLPDVLRQPDGRWSVSGLLRGDEVAAQTGFRIPAGPYETLGGYVLARFGRVPAVGDRLVAGDGRALEVAAMDGRRVDRVLLDPAVEVPA